MSYDLAVWEGERPANDFVAAIELKRLYQRYLGEASDRQDPTPRIVAFAAALLARYPDLDPDAGDDDMSPWSTAPLIDEASGPLMYFPMLWSRSEQVSAVAAQIAAEHELNCYDPQWHQLRTEPNEAWQFELTSERGRPFRDPDAATIRKVLVRLSRANYFAVLSRADGWYVQVGVGEPAGTRPGTYGLERRDGSAEQHFRTELTDIEEVVRAFVGFAENDATFVRRFVWRKYDSM